VREFWHRTGIMMFCFKHLDVLASSVRTTLSLDDDVAAAVQRLREERHIGLSDAVNELIRAGLAAPAQRATFRQQTANLGLRIDVSSVADALEHLDGPEAR
jgi:hypothetical protein